MATILLLVMGVVRPSWAANICNETVPSNRIIDGIPAYQQCTDSTSASIYSSNGVDTATSSAGSDWVRTQSNGGYQCTELAHRYLYFKWAVRSVPNGNAGVWCDGTIPSGLEKTTSPMHGDLIVFAPGSCGADQTTGHVAVVDVVNSTATVTFIEQNRAGRRSCAANTAACFLHATANTGAMVDGGTADGPAPDSASVGGPEASARPDRPSDLQRADLLGSGGAVATGGRVGSGGAPGTGGTSTGPTGAGGVTTAGGAPGSGGQAGTGGAVASAGGSGGAVASAGGSGGAASSTGEPTATSDNGCSCRVGDGRPAQSGAGIAVFLMLGGTLALLRRRRANLSWRSPRRSRRCGDERRGDGSPSTQASRIPA
jgi:MYXO-CTERM domain-containing protein